MALFLNCIITPLACSEVKDNQSFIDRAKAANAGKLPDDPTMQRVPDYEEHRVITYLESVEEEIGGTMHTLQQRKDIKYFGTAEPKLGVPNIFQAKLVEYMDSRSNRPALSYKLVDLVKPSDIGLSK